MYLPTTLEEFKQLGWDQADILLVTGDSYIDSPFIGIAVIGKALMQAGFRVGIIAQPDVHSSDDICRLGEPRIFWGVTGGSIDSMVANYTASRKKRHTDDYTPGGINDRRPDRAVIAYSNLIRRYFKNTLPIVLGGIEASLRRVTHYDYWSDSLRRPILFDAKATYLLYGMAESSVVDLARCLQSAVDPTTLAGLSYIAAAAPDGYLEMPSHEDALLNKQAFIELFHMFYQNNDPLNAKGLWQRVGDRVLVQNPPAPYTDQDGLDAIYALNYERDQHPYYAHQGAVRALETIRFAISTHRGCYGECNFCAIAVHEGRTVRWRSEDSILTEARSLSTHPDFKGYIQDVGGPTANMYGFECSKKLKMGSCADRRCLYPEICPALKIDHSRQLSLLRKIRQIPGVKKAFVASGIRYDMLLNDKKHGKDYLKEIVDFHVSGQLKVAPEHTVGSVLKRMGKPAPHALLEFKQVYDELNHAAGRDQFLTYYLIAAYPGCTDEDMKQLRDFAGEKLHIHPEQVQIFTPTPSTYASLMYYTEMDPFTLEPLFVEKDPFRKDRQKQIVVDKGGQKGRWR
ncbi:MAG TPA: YgiQ family radical SAM protein [Longilinea sp.]|nr:YgiQ family radical SAM protein [Longilinea sp.]